MKASLIILLLAISTQVLAQQNWTLIYHNNINGNAVEGNIDDLISGIRNGEEVRIAWWFQHPTVEKVKVEHLTDAAFLTIQSDSIVLAQIRPIVGQAPDFNEGVIKLRENLEWVFIGGTNGKMDTIVRNVVTGEIVEHNLNNSAFRWYMKKE